MERHLYTYMHSYEARLEELRAEALRAQLAAMPLPSKRSKGVLEDLKNTEVRRRSESLDTGLPEARQRFSTFPPIVVAGRSLSWLATLTGPWRVE